MLSLFIPAIGYFNVAFAENTAQFSLSATSGRPGQRIEIAQVDSCPAIPSGFDYQEVRFTFVDANNVHTASTYFAQTDSNGNWYSDAIIVIPWRDVTPGNPPVTSEAAAVGPATIQAHCVVGQVGADDMDPSDDITQTTQQYASQSFDVTGPSLEFTMSDTTVTPGTVVHLESTDPCTGSEVHGSIINNQAVSNFTAYPDANGNWSAGVPTVSTDYMSEETTNFPTGQYEVNALCIPANGLSSIFYGENILTVADTPSNYVAMGDSYSSGEGVEPFEAGTFEPGTDMCHRSTQAYARLLENDPDLSLNLGSDGFTACSGATTAAITLGNNGEGAQIDKITADTELITMTIGGNNMKFAEFAEECIWNDCSNVGRAEAMKRIVTNVIPQMEYMLGTVRDRLINLGNDNATVLVVGYPQVVTDNPWGNGESTGCEWLDGKQEAKAIRSVTSHLNTAIKNEVNAIGYDFHFVSATESDSPFAGHELCRDSFVYGMPYFYNVIPFPEEKQRYTFHPNSLGQQAYAELIKRYLAQYPLN